MAEEKGASGGSSEEKKKTKKGTKGSKKSATSSSNDGDGGGGDSGGGGGSDGCCFLPNKGKDKRETSSKSSGKWPAPPSEGSAGDKEAAQLLVDWEKSLAKDAVPKFFPKKSGSMDCGNAALELIAEAVKMVSASSSRKKEHR